MAAENYEVNYQINVTSAQAIQSINGFVATSQKLVDITKRFQSVSKQVGKINAAFNSLNKNSIKINVSGNAEQKLKSILSTLRAIRKAAKEGININVIGGVPGGTGGGGVLPPVTRAPRGGGGGNSRNTGNLGYRVFGPSMMDNTGFGAIDMAKGFGISYGIMGLMQGMQDIMKQATSYDNISQNTKNILAAHDKDANFDARFEAMSHQMRKVGVETKFTTEEVAQAGKFLAMAGLNVSDIYRSISPIANIALIGDTDLGQTADVVTNIMTGYNISSKQMGRVSDVLTTTFTGANATLMDVAEAFKYSSLALKKSGTSFETASAAFGILGNAGVQGSTAGTAMRSIVSNLLNPTRKQQKGWDKLGVKTRDESGHLREITDIFSDLHDLHIDPAYFFQMFNRTAAISAMALTDYVDKWKKLTTENFESEGMAEKLAEEKKNTIQGLWDQLTSTFVEDGQKQFESMQNEIKGWLRGATNWLGSQDAMDIMTKVVGMIKSAGTGLLNTGKVLMWVYNTFSPLIDAWIQFTAYTIPLMTGGRIAKSLLNLTRWVIFSSGSIFKMVMSIKALIAASEGFRGFMKAMWAMSVRWVRGTAGLSAGNAVAGAGNAVAGAENAAAGAAGGTVGRFGKFMGGVGRFLTNPYVLAIGGIVAASVAAIAVVSHIQEETEKAIAANNAWAESYRTVGVATMNLSNPDAILIGNMRVYNNVLTTQNEKMTESINLYHRLWLEKNAQKEQDKDPTKFVDTPAGAEFKADLGTASGIFTQDVHTFNKALKILGITHVKSTNPDVIGGGGTYDIYDFFGKQYSTETNNVTVQAALAKLGGSRNNPDRVKLEQFLVEHAFQASSPQDLYRTLEMAKKRYIPTKYATKWDYVSGSDAPEMTFDDIRSARSYVYAFLKNTTDVMKTYKEYATLMKEYDTTGAATPELLNDILLKQFGFWFDPKAGAFGSKEWATNLTRKFKESGWSNEMIGDEVNMVFKQILDFFDGVNIKYKPLFTNMLNRSAWMELLPNGKQLNEGGIEGGSKIGDKRKFNGKVYTWKFTAPTGAFGWLDKDNNPYIPSKGDNVNQYDDYTNFDDGKGGHKGHGRHGSGKSTANPYKSHYDSSNAAPKQIIVRIGNLMKVDKIDMADPNGREAVIGNLKRELASALIDVVADFDENMA